MRYAMARETELVDSAETQQPGIGRAMRSVASRTPFGFQRCVFVYRRTLLVCVALDAGRIRAWPSQSCLLEFKTAMWSCGNRCTSWLAKTL